MNDTVQFDAQDFIDAFDARVKELQPRYETNEDAFVAALLDVAASLRPTGEGPK